MATLKRRRGRGEGSVEQLPSGSWRAATCNTVGGKRVRISRTFKTEPEAAAWLLRAGAGVRRKAFGRMTDAEVAAGVTDATRSPREREQCLAEMIRRERRSA